jgi:protein-S-isoprenylcysteine O-methyltransferase Ste14
MNEDQITARLDIGRIIMVPLCAYVVLNNLFSIYRGLRLTLPSDAIGLLSSINAVLVTSFYALVVTQYVLRPAARRTSRSFTTNAIAVIASLLPLALVASAGNVRTGVVLAVSGAVIGIAGLVFSVYSLRILGRSFSVIPQARVMVMNGPYKYLRHPLYTAEIVTMAGFVLAHPSVRAAVILVAFVLLQLYRAVCEETILVNTFPAYKDYVSTTHRFIP